MVSNLLGNKTSKDYKHLCSFLISVEIAFRIVFLCVKFMQGKVYKKGENARVRARFSLRFHEECDIMSAGMRAKLVPEPHYRREG